MSEREYCLLTKMRRLPIVQQSGFYVNGLYSEAAKDGSALDEILMLFNDCSFDETEKYFQTSADYPGEDR